MNTAKNFFLFFSGFFLASLAQWVDKTFDSPTLDQILYHLHYSEGTGVDMGRVFLLTFLVECLIVPALLAGLGVLLQSQSKRSPWLSQSPFARKAVRTGLPWLVILLGTTVILAQLSAFAWIGYHFAPDHFARQFVEPTKVSIKPSRVKKNLVLIYVESLEDVYGDRKLWGRNLLQPLRDLNGVSFTNYQPVSGATWTIAGMVATQCGIPLRVVSQQNFKPAGKNERSFLPGATCLGDILRQQDYRNVFLGGAPLAFAGKGQFLQDHGYHSAYGRDEWQQEGISESAFGIWGLYDDTLFAQAKVKLTKLHSSGQNFNLTLLTMDTHNPHGFRSPTCRARGVQAFEDIIECTSRQVADFVSFVRSSGYLKDTNVVVLGDHLAVSNPMSDRMRKIKHRTIFNLFITDPPLQKKSEDIFPFDLFPTLIELSGMEIPDHRLGLGYSALPNGQHPSADRLSDMTLPSLSGSSSYEKLWQYH